MSEGEVQYCSSLYIEPNYWETDGLALIARTPGCGCCSDMFPITDTDEILAYLDKHVEWARSRADDYERTANVIREYGIPRVQEAFETLNEAKMAMYDTMKLAKIHLDGLERDREPWSPRQVEDPGKHILGLVAEAGFSVLGAIRNGMVRFYSHYKKLDTVTKLILETLASEDMAELADNICFLYYTREELGLDK